MCQKIKASRNHHRSKQIILKKNWGPGRGLGRHKVIKSL